MAHIYIKIVLKFTCLKFKSKYQLKHFKLSQIYFNYFIVLFLIEYYFQYFSVNI